MKRNLMSIAALAAVLLILTACTAQAQAPSASPAPASTVAGPSASPEGKVFTVEELAKFDGKNGAPAYIAVDGVVYDVSAVPEWKGGTHWGRFSAGRDLTVEIKTLSPHGTSKLKGLPIMGTLAK